MLHRATYPARASSTRETKNIPQSYPLPSAPRHGRDGELKVLPKRHARLRVTDRAEYASSNNFNGLHHRQIKSQKKSSAVGWRAAFPLPGAGDPLSHFYFVSWGPEKERGQLSPSPVQLL